MAGIDPLYCILYLNATVVWIRLAGKRQRCLSNSIWNWLLFSLASVVFRELVSFYFVWLSISCWKMTFSTLSMCLCRIHFNLIYLYIKESATCKNGTFWGHCYRNEVCICFHDNLYHTTINEIQKVDDSISNFSSICSCQSKSRHS